GILVEAMNRQWLKPAIGGRQRLSGDAAVPGFQFSRQEIGEDAERGKIAIRRRYGDEAGPLVDDGQSGIQVKQRNAGMNLPAGTARQSGGLALTQFQGIARVRDGLMGLADDDAVDAYPSRPYPLFGAALRRVGMLPQQPIQQGPDLG